MSSYIGSRVQLRDAETLHLLAEYGCCAFQPWGITITPDGGRAIIGSKIGIYSFHLPELIVDEDFQAPMRTATIIQNAAGAIYFASGHVEGQPAIVRISPRGDLLQQFSVPVANYTGIALSRDEQALLAIDMVGRLHVMDPTSLFPRRAIQLTSMYSIVIPLEPPRVALVGGDFDGPPVLAVVNYESGTIESEELIDVDARFSHLEYGFGNPWAAVDDSTYVVASGQGFLVMDARTGRMVQLIDELPSLVAGDYCCEVAYDPTRDRLIVTDTQEGIDWEARGRVVVYDIGRGEGP